MEVGLEVMVLHFGLVELPEGISSAYCKSQHMFLRNTFRVRPIPDALAMSKSRMDHQFFL